MTDHDKALTLDLTLGFDAVGDPLLLFDFHIPEGGAVTLDSAEGAALHILHTVAQARANAAVCRKLMLDGMPAQQVVHFLRDVMMGPGM
jgi:hypothetical protein